MKNCSAYGRVLVINDGSSDKTEIIATKSGAKVYSNDVSHGYDGALIKGIREALKSNFDIFLTLDADGQHPPNLIPDFIDCCRKKNYFVVLGTRKFYPRVSEKIFNFYTSYFHNIPDVLCGMKAYSKEFLTSIDLEKSFKSIGTYITLEASRRNLKIKKINVEILPRSNGNARFGLGASTELKLLKALFICIISDVKNLLFVKLFS